MSKHDAPDNIMINGVPYVKQTIKAPPAPKVEGPPKTTVGSLAYGFVINNPGTPSTSVALANLVVEHGFQADSVPPALQVLAFEKLLSKYFVGRTAHYVDFEIGNEALRLAALEAAANPRK